MPPYAAGGARHDLARFDEEGRTQIQWSASTIVSSFRHDKDMYTDLTKTQDEQLRTDGGNCPVYLCARDAPPQEPAIRVPVDLIGTIQCSYLKDKCLSRQISNASSVSSSGEGAGSDSGYGDSVCSNSITKARYQLYIPAPAETPRTSILSYHVTTRNYFAFLLGKPLIGHSLLAALRDLWMRLRSWSPDTTSAEYVTYCGQQTYMDFSDNLDHAVAMLSWAEQARCRTVWADAFAHCVGMHVRIADNAEARELPIAIHGMLSRAAVTTKAQVSRGMLALSTFLEDELGTSKVGLSKPARDHLDLFRSFLQSFYVQKVGYYPPTETRRWDRALWLRMYDDFESVYEYLADKEASVDPRSARMLDGGICVEQSTRVFDERYGFTALPFALPLLPEQPLQGDSTTALRSLRRLSRSGSATDVQSTLRVALAQAANVSPEIVSNALVQDYMKFEREQLLNKITAAEARKVRWLLIYGTLQMLISVTRAPKEVRDTTKASYPLCVSTDAWPSWVMERDSTSEVSNNLPEAIELADTSRNSQDDADRISIHPDCEADNAENFFAAKNRLHRSTSDLESMATTHARAPLSRTASLRSSVTSLHRSVVGSLSRRNGMRITSNPFALRRMSSFIQESVPEDEACNSAEEPSSVEDSPVLMKSQPVLANMFRLPQNAMQHSRALVETYVENGEDDESDDELVMEPTLGRRSVSPQAAAVDHTTNTHAADDHYWRTRSSVSHSSPPQSPTSRRDQRSTQPDSSSAHDMSVVRGYYQRRENHRRLSALDFGFAGLDSAEQHTATIPEELAQGLASDDAARRHSVHEETLRMLSGEAAPPPPPPSSVGDYRPRQPKARHSTGRPLQSVNSGTYVPSGINAIPIRGSRVFHILGQDEQQSPASVSTSSLLSYNDIKIGAGSSIPQLSTSVPRWVLPKTQPVQTNADTLVQVALQGDERRSREREMDTLTQETDHLDSGQPQLRARSRSRSRAALDRSMMGLGKMRVRFSLGA